MSATLPSDPERRPWDGAPDASRARYRSQLREIDRQLVALGDQVAARLPNPPLAAWARDAGERDPGGFDRRFRRRCRSLEDRCVVLIARQAPVAIDLREIVAVTRAIADLDRCSRLVVHVGQAVAAVDLSRLPPALGDGLEAIAQAARVTFTSGLEAWRDRDGLAVNELDVLDDEVDRLQENLLADLYRSDLEVQTVVEITLLSRFVERLADHGVALAAHMSWAVTGDRVGSSA